MAPPPAWDIYQQQLSKLGYGQPLWNPSPQSADAEIEIGSVLYTATPGEYTLLFNTAKPAEDASQSKGVPVDFTPFAPKNIAVHGPSEWNVRPPLMSKSMRSIAIEADAGASA